MEIRIDQYVVFDGTVYKVLIIRYTSINIQKVGTGIVIWVERTELIPFGVQMDDKVKVTTTQGTAVCRITHFSYDTRGNLKIHSPDFDVLTNYTSIYYEDFIELADSYDTTTF